MKLIFIAILILAMMYKAAGNTMNDEYFFDEEIPDFYKELGVQRTATTKEIKRAFRKLTLHPDKNKAEGAEESFKLINEANEVLADIELRKIYDVELTEYEEWLKDLYNLDDEILVVHQMEQLNIIEEINYEPNARVVEENSFVIDEEEISVMFDKSLLQDIVQNKLLTRYHQLEGDFGSEFLQDWLEMGVGHVSSRLRGEL